MTPLADLDRPYPEDAPWDFKAGTQKAMRHGMCRAQYLINRVIKKPTGALGGFSATLLAISDFTDTLTDRQCYVICGGSCFV
eukprot:9557232-Karenia_brevis.AAC.1